MGAYRKLGFLWMALLMQFACASGSSPTVNGEDPSDVDFTMASPTVPVLMQAGIRHGEFAPLKVHFTVVDGCGAALPLLQNGTFAGFTDCAEPPIPLAYDKHIPYKVVYDNGSQPIFLLARPDIKSASDLKGKAVATVSGTSGFVALQSYLNKAGLSISDVKFVDMPPQQQVQAYITRQIDAAYTWEPASTPLRRAGAIEIDMTPTGSYSLFSGEFISRHPAVVQAWVCKMTAVAQRALEDLDGVYSDLAAANSQPVDTIKSQLTGQVLAQVDQYNSDWMGTLGGPPTRWAKFISTYSQAMVQQGRISAPMTPEQVQAQFDPQFVKVAHDGGCK